MNPGRRETEGSDSKSVLNFQDGRGQWDPKLKY
jgi:hypothetical protein